MSARFRKTLFAFCGVLFGALLSVGCTDSLTKDDLALGQIALSEAKALIEAHPRRIAGQDSQKVANWIAGQIVGIQQVTLFPFDTPHGKMCNVLAPGRPVQEGTAPVAIIASHFDTKAGIDNFVGANDGASTTGLLIAMARLSDLPVLYLFLDGEECKEAYSMTDGLHGAWFAATTPHEQLPKSLPVIVVDMLGDKDFTPALAGNGTPALNRLAQRAGQQLGITLTDAGAIVDDHVPFVARGRRAIDIIDFDYGPNNAWWHTSEDTLDKLSAESLAKTAALLRVIVGLIEEEQP